MHCAMLIQQTQAALEATPVSPRLALASAPGRESNRGMFTLISVSGSIQSVSKDALTLTLISSLQHYIAMRVREESWLSDMSTSMKVSMVGVSMMGSWRLISSSIMASNCQASSRMSHEDGSEPASWKERVSPLSSESHRGLAM